MTIQIYNTFWTILSTESKYVESKNLQIQAKTILKKYLNNKFNLSVVNLLGMNISHFYLHFRNVF